jgi:sialate O-acetylesterase
MLLSSVQRCRAGFTVVSSSGRTPAQIERSFVVGVLFGFRDSFWDYVPTRDKSTQESDSTMRDCLFSALLISRLNICRLRRSVTCLTLSLSLFGYVCHVRAEVKLPAVLASHMVIQRDLPVHVWGWSTAGEQVRVNFRGNESVTVTDELGRWSLFLPPGNAGGPFEMTVKGRNLLTLSDVLVGDVWVASGQSNMEFEMRKAATAAVDIPKAENSRVRLMIVKKNAADYAQEDVETTAAWSASTPETAREFSAVAWYFAREIEQREKVPVGMIDSTWGGTLAESWTRLAAMGEDAALAPVFAARGHMEDRRADALRLEKLQPALVADAKAKGLPEPKFPWAPPMNMWAPGMLWNGMIAPLTPLPIKGVIWYQGESNSALERAPAYERLFKTLIEDWRRQWQIGEFPFLYVQIANYTSTPLENWPLIREAQRKTLSLRNTGMAVTIDIGNPDDVHPTDKLTVGQRLALPARVMAYGESVEYSGPVFRQITTEGANLRVWFDHAAGLQVKGGSLTAFEVAGSNGVFVHAEAKIVGETVVLSSATVPKPTMARYGWSNSPECDLFNGSGLPASPFQSEK